MSEFQDGLLSRQVEDLLLKETLWRREDANSALANLYLRGTVLTALAISEIGLLDYSNDLFVVYWSLYAILSAAAILGVISFWPRKALKYKLSTIEETLMRKTSEANTWYLEFVKADYLDLEKLITRKTVLIKIGFIICVAALPLLFFIRIGVK